MIINFVKELRLSFFYTTPWSCAATEGNKLTNKNKRKMKEEKNDVKEKETQ